MSVHFPRCRTGEVLTNFLIWTYASMRLDACTRTPHTAHDLEKRTIAVSDFSYGNTSSPSGNSWGVGYDFSGGER